MTAEYPKEAQNPISEPGMRPEDQPAPRQRVPKHRNSYEGHAVGEPFPPPENRPLEQHS